MCSVQLGGSSGTLSKELQCELKEQTQECSESVVISETAVETVAKADEVSPAYTSDARVMQM